MAIAIHYVETAAALVKNYQGETPFPVVLKQFFSRHKKYGSRDRKAIAQLCYSYFRLGKAFTQLPVEERILLGLFYCSHSSNPVLRHYQPSWDNAIESPLHEKEKLTGKPLQPSAIFPWLDQLSDGIDSSSFALSHLVQPKLFLRVRPGFQKQVLDKLDTANLRYTLIGDDALALNNSSNIEHVLQVNKEVVVQDLSSQQTGNIIKETISNWQSSPGNKTTGLSLWDCCAASGGKSIMMHDLFPGMQLTVSDIRDSILQNLKKRFHEAGISNYQSFVADISAPVKSLPAKTYDIVLTDVPCTGSGTWARTPEQLYFFNEKSIDEYAAKQFAIVDNALAFLKPGGWLIYITCSVFKKENEEVIEKLCSQHALSIKTNRLINGISFHADSMYICILQKHA